MSELPGIGPVRVGEAPKTEPTDRERIVMLEKRVEDLANEVAAIRREINTAAANRRAMIS
jgi:hypothetical protein